MALPSGYKRLEYIQSSGTQYVDTGVSAPSGFQADIDFELASLSTTSTNDAIIGAHNDSAPYSRNYFAAKAAGFEVGVGEAYLQGEVPTTNERYMVDVSTVYSDIHLVVNSVEHSLTTDISATDEHSANTLYLLWCHGGSEWFSKCACKLYACRIYASDKLVRDFIPCISDTDEVGLWDDVNAVFYGNAGTGTFVAGPFADFVDVTPTMTSNTVPAGYVASESSNHGGLSAWYAFDSVDSTTSNPSPVWHSAAGVPQWIMLQFPEAVKVTLFSIKNRDDVDATYKQYGPKAFELQGSNDGAEFISLGTYTATGALGDTGLYKVQNPGNYQYYRIYVTEAGYVYGNQQYVVIDQIRFYESVQTVPDVPSNFRIVSESNTEVTIAWDAVEDANGYLVRQSGMMIADTTELTVTAEIQLFGYYAFEVSAYNEYGEGDRSTLAVFRTPDNPILYLVTDRTAEDVDAGNDKGTYNASDLNRVGAAMNYVAARLREQGYDPHISPKTDWKDGEWVDPEAQAVYLGDLAELRKQFTMLASTPEVPPRILATAINSNDGLTYTWANDIEQILMDIDALLTNIAAGWLYSGEIYSGEV